MSGSESAAQEAWEEAGARGRIADTHFASYLDTKRGLRHDAGTHQVRIFAYLLEVHSTALPEESGRDPKWFSPREARKQLAEGRSLQYARQVTNIVDSAVQFLTATRGRRLAFPTGAREHRFIER